MGRDYGDVTFQSVTKNSFVNQSEANYYIVKGYCCRDQAETTDPPSDPRPNLVSTANPDTASVGSCLQMLQTFRSLSILPPFVLRLVEVGRLVCPYETQSCTGRSLVLLVGLTMPGKSAGEGSDKKAFWTTVTET